MNKTTNIYYLLLHSISINISMLNMHDGMICLYESDEMKKIHHKYSIGYRHLFENLRTDLNKVDRRKKNADELLKVIYNEFIVVFADMNNKINEYETHLNERIKI